MICSIYSGWILGTGNFAKNYMGSHPGPKKEKFFHLVWEDEWMYASMDGWMDGWIIGWMDSFYSLRFFFQFLISPTFFHIYINDLLNLPSNPIDWYADDITLHNAPTFHKDDVGMLHN